MSGSSRSGLFNRIRARLREGVGARRRNDLLGPVGRENLLKAERRLRKFKFFDADEYLALNPDIIVMDRAEHFMLYGSHEGRTVVSRKTIARQIGRSIDTMSKKASAVRSTVSRPPAEPKLGSRNFGVYCNSLSNAFMHEIADDLADCLEAAGVDVRRLDEKADRRSRPDICIYVAPHEFFVLGDGPDWVADDVFRNAIAYNTEQPQTTWFWRGLPFALLSCGVVDMSWQAADAFAPAMPAVHLFPGARVRSVSISPSDRAHPLLAGAYQLNGVAQSSPTEAFGARPLDIAFFGARSPMREHFFARNAEALSRFESVIYLRDDARPIAMNDGMGNLSAVSNFISGNAKIVLSLHRDEFGYFEWHRMIRQGMALGSIVVSDICVDHPLLKAGRHFFMAEPRHIPQLLQWVLETPDGRVAAEAVRQNCFELLRTTLAPIEVGRRLSAFCERSVADGAAG